MKKFKKPIILGSAVLILVLGGVFALSTVNAQNQTGTTVISKVAQILGIEEQELSDAFKTAEIEKIDELVDEGKIDQEKAEILKKKIIESENPIPGFGLKRRRRKPPVEAICEFLDMTEKELETAKEEGKIFPELLEENGKTMEEFHEFLKKNYRELGPRGKGFVKGMGVGIQMNDGECPLQNDTI